MKRDLLLGSTFRSLQDLNSQALAWLERVIRTEHGTTHEIPRERLQSENLQVLHEKPEYRVIITEQRKISRDCYLSYQGNRYSVPYQHAGQTAEVQIERAILRVLVRGTIVCEHKLLPGSSRVARNRDHFTGLLAEVQKQRNQKKRIHAHILSVPAPVVECRELATYEVYGHE